MKEVHCLCSWPCFESQLASLIQKFWDVIGWNLCSFLFSSIFTLYSLMQSDQICPSLQNKHGQLNSDRHCCSLLRQCVFQDSNRLFQGRWKSVSMVLMKMQTCSCNCAALQRARLCQLQSPGQGCILKTLFFSTLGMEKYFFILQGIVLYESASLGNLCRVECFTLAIVQMEKKIDKDMKGDYGLCWRVIRINFDQDGHPIQEAIFILMYFVQKT